MLNLWIPFQAATEPIIFALQILAITPEDVSDTIAKVKSTFVPVTGKPTDEDFLRLR